ncbi:MAG: helix-turn-helix domain-containing protein [bacterium]|nr:helix-turn-helix domain-containing protein [bacterium]
MTKLTDYVTVTEAARILGCSPNTARKWGERGDIPMRRNPANGYRLFRRDDLDSFLNDIAKPVSRAKKKPK